jgi:hypothetical protein
MKNVILKLKLHALLGLLVLVTFTFGISQAEGKITLEFSPQKFVDPAPSPGTEIEVNITLRDFDGTQGAGNIAVIELYIDYDSTVVQIETCDPPECEEKGTVLPSTLGGPINFDGYTNFNTHQDEFTTQMAVNTNENGELNPPPSGFANPGNVHRFAFLSATTSVPLTPPAAPEDPITLITITFTVINSPSKTPVIFIESAPKPGILLDSEDNELDFDQESGELRLPVVLSASGAIWHMSEGIKVFWEAESQQENLGWNIYRSETKDGKFVKVNGELVKGAGTTSTPIKYSFIDKDAEKGKIYYYYLEDISFNGGKHRTPLIRTSLVNKATSWGAIKHSALH